MSAKILQFTGRTRLELPPDQILEDAIGKLEKVLIVGYDKEDKLYATASCVSIAEAVFMLEKIKCQLMAVGED